MVSPYLSHTRGIDKVCVNENQSKGVLREEKIKCFPYVSHRPF